MSQPIEIQIPNNLFHKVVEAAPNAMIMIDRIGKILLVNLQTEKLFGYSREELLGSTIEILVPDRFHGGHPHLRNGFFHSPKTRAMGAGRELFGRRKDGSEVPVEIGLNPLEIEGNIFVLTSIIDITERKKAEQLVASREAALEASRLKSQFLATMSHEIRTPLNGIIGLTNLLFTMEMTEPQKEYLQGIRTSADALLALINDILDLSKIEADKMEFEIVNFNIAQVMADAVSVTTAAAKEKGLKILSSIDENLSHWFQGDGSKVKQVLINLLGNAVKFTNQGEIAVSVCKLDESFHPFTVEFEVKDTGIGIDRDVREKLFEPFTQGDSSTSRKYGGTGLGLSISKKLIEKMSGIINVDSVPNQGTRFWFRLPLREGHEVVIEKASKNYASNPAVKDIKILVVEDNAINQRVALGTLKNLGFTGQAVGNGLEALDILKKFKFDLVLMDCHMPEMDGYEATVRIRESEDLELRNIPIVAMTANVMQGDRERCLRVGMNDYISKPLVQKDLERVLNDLLFPTLHPTSAKSEKTESLRSGKINLAENMQIAIHNVLKGHGEELTIELLQLFLQTTPSTFQKISEGITNKNYQLVIIESHGLKSSGLLFGLTDFSWHAMQLEMNCKHQKYSSLAEELDKLEEQFELVTPLLETQISLIKKNNK